MSKIGRVLSLAGGGSWALIEARALMELYPNLSGRQILAQFDVAIGNSGGAIVLAGLAADMTPGQIHDLFRNQAQLHQLYTPVRGIDQLFSHVGLAPKYSSAGKLNALRSLLRASADQPLTSLPCKIAICAYDLDRNLEAVFRSYPSPLAPTSSVFVPTLAEAAHASSSAPVVYFDTPAVITNQANPADTRRFWDGGLGSYNVPARAGLTEAHALGFDAVHILSLGTSLTWRPLGGQQPLYAPPGDPALIGALKCLARDCINAPASAALCDAAMCPNTFVIHLSPYLIPDYVDGAWTIPVGLTTTLGKNAYAKLIGFDMDIIDPADIALLSGYAEAWISGQVANQPIIADPLTGAMIQGDATFGVGMAGWHMLTNPPAG